MTRPPVVLIGSSAGRTTSWPGVSVAAAASSPIVLPVTVIAPPWSRPASSRRLRDERHAAGVVEVGRDVPAARLQVGDQRRRVADRGRSRRCRAATPASRAIASRCSTALVEPPVATTPAIAFSNASRVRMSRGRTPRCSRSITSAPTLLATASFVVEHRRDAGAAERREAEELAGHRHRVGGELAAAGAGAGAGVIFEVAQLRVASSCRPRARRPLRTRPGS